jgi:hypothetical protein
MNNIENSILLNNVNDDIQNISISENILTIKYVSESIEKFNLDINNFTLIHDKCIKDYPIFISDKYKNILNLKKSLVISLNKEQYFNKLLNFFNENNNNDVVKYLKFIRCRPKNIVTEYSKWNNSSNIYNK